MEPAERFGKQTERRREQLALERALARVLERRDQEFVGQPATESGEHDEAVALEDEPLARSKLRLEVTADCALAALFFGSNRRRRLLEPGELGVVVRKARAGLAPFV